MKHQLLQKWILPIIAFVVCNGVTACLPAPAASAVLPTVAQLPTVTASLTATPTSTPPLATAESGRGFTATPAYTVTPSATITDTPDTMVTAFITATHPPPVGETGSGGPPTLTPTLLPAAFVFGTSAGGRELMAYRFGTGSRIILLVGGIHTGYETNTVGLLRELIDHYTRQPDAVLPGIALVLIPALNPDGLQYGEQLRGRFNGNEVDLNRNWGCDWSPTAVFKEMAVNPGRQPFSEPETTALGGFIQQVHPAAALFYHAAARGVFPGSCGGTLSDDLGQVYSKATGYPYQTGFGSYTVTGSAPNWVDSLGIPAADIELATADDTEFVRNLNGIRAVQAWVLSLP